MRPTVHGLELDPQTLCAHWHSPRDVIAIKMRCCGEYYSCRQCHDALAGHPAVVWPASEWDQPAILCGVWAQEQTVREYLDGENHCPTCGAAFNPGCKTHHHLYFERKSTNETGDM